MPLKRSHLTTHKGVYKYHWLSTPWTLTFIYPLLQSFEVGLYKLHVKRTNLALGTNDKRFLMPSSSVNQAPLWCSFWEQVRSNKTKRKKVCGWLKRWDIDFNFVGTFYFLEEFVWYHLLRDLKLKKELAESIIFFRVFFQQTDRHIHTSYVAFTCQVKWRHNACFIDLVWSLGTCLSFSAFLACPFTFFLDGIFIIELAVDLGLFFPTGEHLSSWPQ